jgi:hypothetical protein
MRYILLFKGSCAVCSKVAGMVDDLSVDNLEARSIESAEIRQILSGAGLETPGRPALLMTSDAGVRMVSGWEMRRHLAGLLGWRRARAIGRLAAAEWRARLTQATGSDVPSRRGVVKAGLAGLAGIAGAAVIPGKALAASQPAASGPVLSIAGRSTVERALAVSAVQTAIQTFGPVEPTVQVVTSGNQRVLMLVHGQTDILTMADISASAGSDPTVLGMGKSPVGAGLRFYTVSGAALGDLTTSNGQVTATAAASDPIPDVTPGQILRFLECIGAHAGPACIENCIGCVTGGTFGVIIDCPQCAICAGPHAITCARRFL